MRAPLKMTREGGRSRPLAPEAGMDLIPRTENREPRTENREPALAMD
ncbi:MAG: hypothetical protein AAFQ43_09915 [Bacteroidota bacterium]